MRKIGMGVKPENEVDDSKSLKKEIAALKKENAVLRKENDELKSKGAETPPAV